MSVGLRIPLGRADAVAAAIMRLWDMNAPACAVVGSVRRRKAEVGDIELIAPLPEVCTRPIDPLGPKPEKPTDATDPLYARMLATTGADAGLFEPDPPPPVARAVEGLKPGFLAASLEVNIAGIAGPADGAAMPIPVQVYRYTPGERGNRGWIELMRTGPREFGIWFLTQWKAAQECTGDRRGSIDGWLVDRYGVRVPTPSEDDCFRLIRRAFVPPEERQAFVEAEERRAARERERSLR